MSEVVEQDNEKIGYDLLDLESEKLIPFIRRSGQKNWEKIGPYFFIPQGLAWAERIILRSKDAEILVVDEIGPLELEGKGLWPALKKIIFQRHQKFIFVVRRSIVNNLLEIIGKNKIKIIHIKQRDIFHRMIEEIKKP